jgi:hypothetical protein
MKCNKKYNLQPFSAVKMTVFCNVVQRSLIESDDDSEVTG